MLTERFPIASVRRVLLPADQWHPFPRCAERAPWDGLPATVRAEVVGQGEKALASPWPHVPATSYLEFVRSGNRRACEDRYFPRRSLLAQLVLAECAEGHGRFLDAIVDAAWSLCEESSWCISAHIGAQQAGSGLPDVREPIVDLFAAETGALIAWTAYLLSDRLDAVSPRVLPRLHSELAARVLHPCLVRDDFWWIGADPRRALNNWTPWICSNWLAAALLAETDAERRSAAVHKAMLVLDRFLAQQPPDGGCDEGPGYWNRAGASVFDFLELLRSASAGAIDVFAEPLVRNLGAYIHRVHIGDDWFVNFADGPARQHPDGGLLWRFGRACGDAELAALGRFFAARPPAASNHLWVSLPRRLPDLFDPVPGSPDVPSAPLGLGAWFPDLQVMTARCAPGTARGFFVAAKGGHNAESHNHNDVGNIIVFLDGRPVLVDPGVETYTAKTFSARRYEIWTMQSSYHNLPAFGAWQQRPGHEARAAAVRYDAGDREVVFSLDLAPAYPPAAGVLSCRRSVALRRGEGVDLADEYRLAASGPATLCLMTPCAVRLAGAGRIELLAREGDDAGLVRAVLEVSGSGVSAACEPVAAEDPRLRNVWTAGLNRIRLELSPVAVHRLAVCIRRGSAPPAQPG